MIYDSRNLEDGVTLEADVCIAGAGAAGITLARSLRARGLSVLVLESGGLETDDNTQALYDGTLTGNTTWQLNRTRVRVFGGSTHHWSGWCRPLSPEDFEPRGDNPGWPIPYSSLVPYYERAQEDVEIGAFDYDAVALAERLGQPLLAPGSDVIETRFYQYSPPTRFGKAYREELDTADDVSVYLHANLREIRLEQGHDRISHLECRTLDGGHFSAKANRYVLALGGLENARLLLASRDQIPTGVANGSGNVGRFFMEHPHYYGGFAALTPELPDLRFYLKQTVNIPLGDSPRNVPIRGALSLTRPARDLLGVCNFAITVDGMAPVDAVETGDLDPSLMNSVFGAPVRAPMVLRMTCRSEQSAVATSRLTLSETDVDALGMPRIRLHWEIDDADTFALTRALELLGCELARFGIGRMWTWQENHRLRTPASEGAHHIGTTRMSSSPEDGVVDSNLRSHEVENLYIAGSSVFPTGGDANPTLTIVAMAHRLADHLAN